MRIQTILAMLIAGTMCQFTTGLSRAQDVGSASPAKVKGPIPIIQEKIRGEVAARLAEAGAGFDALQVTVAVQRDSGTPFKVTYRGLRNFKGADGTTPSANGEFIMEYIGGGQWQGALAGTQFTATVGTKDNIDLPFVNDPQALGEWESVDFVADISSFKPDRKSTRLNSSHL